MTDPDQLDDLDRTARAASAGLRAHVDRHVEPELMLAALPPSAPANNRTRLLAAAAIAALFIASVAILGDGPNGDERSRLELDEDGNELPAPEPGVLTPLGPRDGRDSLQLPVTVDPSVDLTDGQPVTVTGPGFAPGERVGIVQCASEAGKGNGGTREEQVGIDACDTGGVQYADADAQGVATGRFNVRRVLTTPATGTVDCAIEPQRCIVAMGALNDYDRSGGYGVAFRAGGEPIHVPTITVSPADGLVDGDLVHVEGQGFGSGPVWLSLCSIDPAGCWSVGNSFTLTREKAKALGLDDSYGPGTVVVGLLADQEGRVAGDVRLWRYLPTTEPGSYIDCAVSRCSLRVTSETSGLAPAPPVVRFAPGGTGPTAPAIAASPTRDLRRGEKIVVRGAGFQPGAYYSISLCATAPEDPADVYGCVGPDGEQQQIDEDGGFAQEVEVPDLVGLTGSGGATATTACAQGGCSPRPSVGVGELCDGVHTSCTIHVDSYEDSSGAGPPRFQPVPIPFTLG
jgi:hypothetical protein